MTKPKCIRDTHFLNAIYMTLAACLCLLLLSSCAHDPKLDKQIHEEAAAQPVLGASARAEEAQQIIQSSTLSEEQKAKLSEITRAATADMKALRDQEAQLRVLLVKRIVNPQASTREVEGIKRRILELNQKTNKRWLAAIDDAQATLGRREQQDERFYRAFMQEPGTDGSRAEK